MAGHACKSGQIYGWSDCWWANGEAIMYLFSHVTLKEHNYDNNYDNDNELYLTRLWIGYPVEELINKLFNLSGNLRVICNRSSSNSDWSHVLAGKEVETLATAGKPQISEADRLRRPTRVQ